MCSEHMPLCGGVCGLGCPSHHEKEQTWSPILPPARPMYSQVTEGIGVMVYLAGRMIYLRENIYMRSSKLSRRPHAAGWSWSRRRGGNSGGNLAKKAKNFQKLVASSDLSTRGQQVMCLLVQRTAHSMSTPIVSRP